MKLSRIVDWLDSVLDVKAFSDVSNNGVQIARRGDDAAKVAFAVDASVRSVEGAAAAGAQLLVVHHGISWGGGIQRLEGGVYNVVKAAMDADLALYAAHLPLDANRAYGNNFELARFLGLKDLKRAFVYHGETIGVVGTLANGKKVGVCSGGAGCHAVDAKELGCDLFVTGEASDQRRFRSFRVNRVWQWMKKCRRPQHMPKAPWAEGTRFRRCLAARGGSSLALRYLDDMSWSPSWARGGWGLYTSASTRLAV